MRRQLRTILAFFLVGAMALALSPAKAYAAVPEARTPLHAGVEVPAPLAIFGSNIVFGTHRSTNGGATWTTDPALAATWWSYAGNGKLAGTQYSTAGILNAVVYTIATGQSQAYPLPDSSGSVTESSALMYVYPDTYSVYDFVTGGSVPISATASPDAQYPSPRLTASGGVLWSAYAADYSMLYSYATSPTAQPGPWVSGGNLGSVVTASQIIYAQQSGSTVEVCVRPLASPSSAPTCTVEVTGVAQNTSWAQFSNFGATTVVDLSSVNGTPTRGGTLLWTGSALKPITLPTRSTLSQPASASYADRVYGDTPYLVVRDANTIPSVMRMDANGKLKKGFALPKVAIAPMISLAVAPDRIVGGDSRDGSTATPAWVRTVSGSAVGPESLLTVRASWILTSAGRTVVSGTAGMTVYDRGVAKKTVTDARLTQLSGPYLSRTGYSTAADMGQIEVSTVAGAPVTTFLGTSGSLFGSTYVGWTNGSPTVTVDDLTGASPQRSVTLSGDTTACYSGQAWGTKLYLACNGQVRLFSLTDGSLLASFEAPGTWGFVSLMAVGDGYAIVSTDNVAFNVWDGATGTLTPLTGCSYQIVTDGVGHIACTTGTDLIWRDFSSLSPSAPYLLGTLADGSVSFAATTSWPLAMDTTKALKAGTVTIANADGTVVRSLAVPASADGSVRVAWDGLDATGKPVAVGTYTYTLVASGADGSGSVVSITGTGTASGTVSVTAAACQGRADAAQADRRCHR